MKAIPLWLNCDRYLAWSPAQRINSIQALLDSEGIARATAQLRGLPNEPPQWLDRKQWAKADPDLRIKQLLALEQHAVIHTMMEARAQHDRAEMIKSCQHEWLVTPGVATQACAKCGTVR